LFLFLFLFFLGGKGREFCFVFLLVQGLFFVFRKALILQNYKITKMILPKKQNQKKN